MADFTVYTISGCPFCRALLKEYRKEAVNFHEVCVSGDAALRQRIKEQYGVEHVPVVVRDGLLIQSGDTTGG